MGNLKKFSVAFALSAGIALFFLSCSETPLTPPAPASDNLVAVATRWVYTRVDSLNQRHFSDTRPNDGNRWEAGSAVKVSFHPDPGTWDAEKLNGVVMYTVYRRYKGTSQASVVCRTFGASDRFNRNDILYYQSSLGVQDTILFDSLDYVYDVVNNYNLADIQYAVAATVDIDISGAQMSGGFEGGLSYSAFLGEGSPTRFLIDEGRAVVPTRAVSISGQFDTSGLTALVIMRYSELSTLDSAAMIRQIAPMFLDSFSQGYFAFSDSIMLISKPDSILRRVTKERKIFDYGRMGPVDTILRADFASVFPLFNGSAADPMVSFSKRDTLVSGLGKKWIVIQGVWDASYTGNRWDFLSDDIEITPYYPYLALDKSASRIRTKAIGKDYQICLLNDDIPFEFNTFGDTTFSDTIEVWIATRQYTSAFVDNLLQITVAPLGAVFLPDGATFNYNDCMLETPPKRFVLNQNGIVRGKLDPDFEADYRVSPLKEVFEDAEIKANGLKILNYTPAQLSATVKPGSILGFKESDLGRFFDSLPSMSGQDWRPKVALSNGWNNLNFFAGSSQLSLVCQGWHTLSAPHIAYYVSKFPKDTLLGYWYNFLPELRLTPDGRVLTQAPFRGIPLNMLEIRNGYKEFVILVYARGRFFNEPRVFISRINSKYKYVWDKIPPQIAWTENSNPTSSTWYAPYYYQGKGTNLLMVDNIFNVCLSQVPTGDKETSIRDVGFGKIVSAVLCFHSTEEPFNEDPVTGLRTYSTPIKRYPLDPALLVGQGLFSYGDTPGASTKDHESWAITSLAFRDIDARRWKNGIWDMWIETEDDLGNKGMAPFAGDGKRKDAPYRYQDGYYFVRQIEIK